MNILYFSYVDLDTPDACQTHTLGILAGFAANGCQVDAVVPRPLRYRPEMGAVKFHFISPFYGGGRRYLLRQVPYSAFILWSLCRRYRYDAIYARDMDVFIGPRLCSQFFGIPLYLEIDDTPVSGSYSFFRKVVELNLKLDYRQAAGLIVPSLPRCQIINRQYQVPRQKIHLIMNGTEEPDRGRLPSKAEAKRRLGLPAASFCLGYLGNIYERYDFTTMLEAMARCATAIPDLYFIIIGGGSGLDQVKQQAAALGVASRVIFTGYMHAKEFARVMPAMDVGLMLLTKTAALEHGPIHTKTATYASFALPVVTAGYSLDEFPEEIQQGVWLTPPEDAAALAARILHLYKNPGEGKMRARSLQEYVRKRLTWQAVAGDILAVMEKS